MVRVDKKTSAPQLLMPSDDTASQGLYPLMTSPASAPNVCSKFGSAVNADAPAIPPRQPPWRAMWRAPRRPNTTAGPIVEPGPGYVRPMTEAELLPAE